MTQRKFSTRYLLGIQSCLLAAGIVSLVVWPMSSVRIAECAGLGGTVIAIRLIWPEDELANLVSGSIGVLGISAATVAFRGAGSGDFDRFWQPALVFLAGQSVVAIGVAAIRRIGAMAA